MEANHEVISAFLDNERFDPSELAEALADPAGRTLLIDLVALGHLVQPAPTPAVGRARWTPRYLAFAAAGLLLAVATGYVAGVRQSDMASTRAPEPTRVVSLADRQWQ